MLKLNVYVGLLFALIAGIVAMSDKWHSVFVAVIIMIVAVMVANDWGTGRSDNYE